MTEKSYKSGNTAYIFRQPQELRKAAEAVQAWWVGSDASEKLGGAPACIFMLRSALAALAARATKPEGRSKPAEGAPQPVYMHEGGPMIGWAPATKPEGRAPTCPVCNDSGVQGTPGAPCPFCKTAKLGAEYAALVKGEELRAAAQALRGHIRTLRLSGRNDAMVEDMERAARVLAPSEERS